mmetsp:Transcript_96066/g.271710  ORF Transcript_96066/g.271710 Transcript_96066/m.271710 type:complete len:322 (+) Transcript_96066:143-1108(+)
MIDVAIEKLIDGAFHSSSIREFAVHIAMRVIHLIYPDDAFPNRFCTITLSGGLAQPVDETHLVPRQLSTHGGCVIFHWLRTLKTTDVPRIAPIPHKVVQQLREAKLPCKVPVPVRGDSSENIWQDMVILNAVMPIPSAEAGDILLPEGLILTITQKLPIQTRPLVNSQVPYLNRFRTNCVFAWMRQVISAVIPPFDTLFTKPLIETLPPIVLQVIVAHKFVHMAHNRFRLARIPPRTKLVSGPGRQPDGKFDTCRRHSCNAKEVLSCWSSALTKAPTCLICVDGLLHEVAEKPGRPRVYTIVLRINNRGPPMHEHTDLMHP